MLLRSLVNMTSYELALSFWLCKMSLAQSSKSAPATQMQTLSQPCQTAHKIKLAVQSVVITREGSLSQQQQESKKILGDTGLIVFGGKGEKLG